MAQLRFDLAYGSQNVVRNSYFENGFSFQAADWIPVIWSAGVNESGAAASGRTEHLFLSDQYGLDNITLVPADSQYKRGIYNEEAVIAAQGGAGFPGIWARQEDRLNANQQYDLTYRVRSFVDLSTSFGLPAGSGYVEIRLGSGAVPHQSNAVGLYTSSITAAADEALYIVMYACKATVEFITVEGKLSTAFTTVENPVNWDVLTETIKPDETLRGVFSRFIEGVTFHDTGYDLLKNAFDLYGTETNVLCQIYERDDPVDPWALQFDGNILFDNAEFNESRSTVEVVIEGVSDIAQITRQKESPFNIYASHSVDGEHLGNISIVNSGGTRVTIGATNNYTTWYVHDVLEFAVAYVSNGDLTFSSPDLGGTTQGYLSNGQFSAFVMTSGNELRLNQGDYAYITLKDLFDAVYMAFGLYAKLDGSQIVLKPLDELYDINNSVQTIDNIPDFMREMAQDIRFKSITMGYEEFDEEPPTRGEPHGSIVFKFPGQNTSGGAEDVLSKVIASNNIINTKLAESPSAAVRLEYDESFFFLELQGHTTYTTKGIISAPPYNVAVPTPINNETIFPWRCYERHRKNIYESSNLSNVNGDITAGLLGYGAMLDFYQSTTWYKDRPGQPADLYLKWLYLFDYPLTRAEVDAIIADFEYHFLISTTDSGHVKAWLFQIERRIKNGLSSFQLISED